MARRRKQTHDPRQLSFFDVMANQIEEIREENIQDYVREESIPVPVARVEQAVPAMSLQKVLKPETINDVRSGGYTSLGYSILDRWALNSPEELKKLETMGDIPFMVKLYGQQQTEARALSSETARLASLRGMSDSEILESMGIDMSLKITG